MSKKKTSTFDRYETVQRPRCMKNISDPPHYLNWFPCDRPAKFIRAGINGEIYYCGIHAKRFPDAKALDKISKGEKP